VVPGARRRAPPARPPSRRPSPPDRRLEAADAAPHRPIRDAWNTCWLGLPTLLPERRAALDAACAEVGRDPATIETTVGVSVAFPDLDPTIEGVDDPDRVLTGTAAEVAAGLRAHAAAGVGHVIVNLAPNTPPAWIGWRTRSGSTARGDPPAGSDGA
jgi:alkanesulfonate monooxygenase SsuD/methylene tetrahydromethanopterin reductase-like flavin-dependent oxidoreductase (luciferase family)